MCQSWAAVQPHRSMYLNTETHNYCRNPDNNIDGPWCYVHDQKLKKGPCTGIPLCEGKRHNNIIYFLYVNPYVHK